MSATKKPEFYVDGHFKARNFEATVGTRGGKSVYAFVLVECEVDDPDRFAYSNGSWWKIEQPD
ncbi:hypothetical protein K7H13_13835 [Qipengyuania citrea]|jgi:hypothetical protein|uniref:hypothetical protein n=1 Tax=Qipengyuania citrea TaxID=225971 RepID=UPI001E5439B7|nr:hypothetical protein [Qipengyuania citrea]MCD1591830.1 hypothetical protein [Qipengyuania citrea]